MAYFGVTCYSSLKLWLRYDRNIKFEVLKCFFCYGAFKDQVMAMFQCVKCYKVLKRLLNKMLCGVNVGCQNKFVEFRRKVHFNSKKRRRKINMDHSFVKKCSSIPRIFDHTKNGELIHDCYYDILDSDRKLVFISRVKYVKITDEGCQLRSCCELLKGNDVMEVDYDLSNINVDVADRKPEYFKFVQTFDCYITF